MTQVLAPGRPQLNSVALGIHITPHCQNYSFTGFMSTTAPDVPSAPPDSLEQQSARHTYGASDKSGWRARVRWFAAEFLVVVTGVLVALALQAWYEDRQDRDRETAYLA